MTGRGGGRVGRQPPRSTGVIICTDARRAKILDHLRRLDLGAITDMGFTGWDDDPDNPTIVVGKKKPRSRNLTQAEKDANKLISRERAANEHGFGDLKQWRCLAKLRSSPKRATTRARGATGPPRLRDRALTIDHQPTINALPADSRATHTGNTQRPAKTRMEIAQ